MAAAPDRDILEISEITESSPNSNCCCKQRIGLCRQKHDDNDDDDDDDNGHAGACSAHSKTCSATKDFAMVCLCPQSNRRLNLQFSNTVITSQYLFTQLLVEVLQQLGSYIAVWHIDHHPSIAATCPLPSAATCRCRAAASAGRCHRLPLPGSGGLALGYAYATIHRYLRDFGSDEVQLFDYLQVHTSHQ